MKRRSSICNHLSRTIEGVDVFVDYICSCLHHLIRGKACIDEARGLALYHQDRLAAQGHEVDVDGLVGSEELEVIWDCVVALNRLRVTVCKTLVAALVQCSEVLGHLGPEEGASGKVKHASVC